MAPDLQGRGGFRVLQRFLRYLILAVATGHTMPSLRESFHPDSPDEVIVMA